MDNSWAAPLRSIVACGIPGLWRQRSFDFGYRPGEVGSSGVVPVEFPAAEAAASRTARLLCAKMRTALVFSFKIKKNWFSIIIVLCLKISISYRLPDENIMNHGTSAEYDSCSNEWTSNYGGSWMKLNERIKDDPWKIIKILIYFINRENLHVKEKLFKLTIHSN